MKHIYLGLGSNRGDRIGNINRALGQFRLSGIEIIRVSSFYRTEPLDFTPQPWFVNCVAEVRTDLLPLKLLRACRAVELGLGRRPGVAKGPRVIDIDILLYEDAVIRSVELDVPHPRMAERRFALVPLRELAPGLRHPVTGQSVLEMLHDSTDHSQVVRLRNV